MNETFIGGFMSGFLSRGFAGLRVGYGFYFTTARLFGVDPRSHGGSELAGTMAGYIEGQLMPTLPPDENAKVIAELERVRDMELKKDEIRSIRLSKPLVWGLGFGHVTIEPVAGRPIKVQLRHPIAYDRLVQLTQAFSPELARR